MKIAFKCGVCGKPYEVDVAQAGRRGRCAKCGEEMTVPQAPPSENRKAAVESYDGYALDEAESTGPSLYTPPRGNDDLAAPPLASERAARSKGLSARMKRVKPGQFAKWRGPLIGLGVTVVVMAALALVFPALAIGVGAILALAGMLLTCGGYAMGAYAAFSEDFLYGFLYLVVPLYTAWFLVSRFDELKAVVLAIALGLGLSLVGGWALEYGHASRGGHGGQVNSSVAEPQ